MQQYYVSCVCGLQLRVLLKENAFVQIYCDRCNRLVFPQETFVSTSPRSSETAPEVRSRVEDEIEGAQIDNYRVIRKIGAGGMGTVYLAVHSLTQEKVVIKALNMEIDKDQYDMILNYFIREAQILMELEHPNIVKFMGCGNSHGRPYFVMEYIQGEDLKSILIREKKIRLSQAIYIVFHVAAALDYAYKLVSREGEHMKLIHRDIKPSNIILVPQNKMLPKLIDFGLAKSMTACHSSFTQEGTVMGSLFYIPREQILEAKNADHRSDIYSLGATFYHMLAGYPPYFEFERLGNVAIMNAIVQNKITPLSKYCPNVPVPICDIVEKAMAPSPEDRYTTAKHLQEDLHNFIESLKK